MTTKAERKRTPESRTVELRPDGWERFRVAVKAAGVVGPKHRKAKKLAKSAK